MQTSKKLKLGACFRASAPNSTAPAAIITAPAVILFMKIRNSAFLLVERPTRRAWGKGRVKKWISAPRGETLLPLPPQPIERFMASARSKATAEGWRVGARYVVRDNTKRTVINKEIKRVQGFCPWSPPQESVRNQSSSARRCLPSKGEARALHHQPAPALTLYMPCLCFSSSQFPDRWLVRNYSTENKGDKWGKR